MELSGGVCGALAAGTVDPARWVPEALGVLAEACARGAPVAPGAPALAGPAAAAIVAAAAVAALAGALARRVGGGDKGNGRS
jgi:hypothetical protein